MARIKLPSTALTGNSTDVFTSPLNKLWRAKILLNRVTSGMPQNKGDKIPVSKISPFINEHYQEINRNKWLLDSENRHKQEDTPLSVAQERQINNQIIIINPNTSPYTKIIIQGMPSELDINPESSWATVKSMGRNNSFMFYTGGEDTISFDISWYSVQSDREDVINKCKLLESWTRADGYKAAPPTLYISWGNSDLFKDDTFILSSAKYTLSNFQNAARTTWNRDKNTQQIDLKLLPNCAVQNLVFKKVTLDNTTHERIIPKSKLEKTNGVIV